MTFKKWIMTYIVVVLIFSTFLGAFNVAVDPFGVFGDKLMHWFAYNMTNNPRVAKITYLEQNKNLYDSWLEADSGEELINEDQTTVIRPNAPK